MTERQYLENMVEKEMDEYARTGNVYYKNQADVAIAKLEMMSNRKTLDQYTVEQQKKYISKMLDRHRDFIMDSIEQGHTANFEDHLDFLAAATENFIDSEGE